MENQNCGERDKLQREFSVATVHLVAECSNARRASAGSDNSEFLNAIKLEEEAEEAYARAASALAVDRNQRAPSFLD